MTDPQAETRDRSTLVFLAAFATGGGVSGPRSWPWATSPARRAGRPVSHRIEPTRRRRRRRPRAGCSSSAACSTRKASRCRTRRSPLLRRKLLFAGPGSEGASRRRPAMGRATRRAGSGSMRPARRRPITAQFGATAMAPGYGVGWAELDPDEDQPSAEIRLMPEQVIEGRLFDVQGQPVPGAVVSVSAIWRTPPTDRARRVEDIEDQLGRTTTAGGAASTTCRAGRSRRRPTPTAASTCTASAAACTPG